MTTQITFQFEYRREHLLDFGLVNRASEGPGGKAAMRGIILGPLSVFLTWSK